MDRKLLILALLGAFSATGSSGARAEIVKSVSIDCSKGQICFYWWPKLPPIPGWHTDRKANLNYGGNGMNSLVPNGFTFTNADAIIYATANYKARYEADNPNAKSLGAFIADDKATFASEHPGMSIAEIDPLVTAEGLKLRSFTYFRPQDKTFEQVTYGEEGDYYLVFTISARSEVTFRSAHPAYVDLVKRYHK